MHRFEVSIHILALALALSHALHQESFIHLVHGLPFARLFDFIYSVQARYTHTHTLGHLHNGITNAAQITVKIMSFSICGLEF